MKERGFKAISRMMLMAVFLIGMMMILPQNAQAATQQVKFRNYDNKIVTDIYVNDIITGSEIRLPENWKYTDEDVTITNSDENIIYVGYDRSEPNWFYVNENYDVPYKKYKTVVITATKTDAATGDQKVAKLNVHRYKISCKEKTTVYAGTKFKLDYTTIYDGKKWSGVKRRFYTENNAIATVSSSGVVTAKKAGTVWITVNNVCGTSSTELTVKPLPSLNKKTASLDIGKSTKLTMKNMPKGTKLTWKSSNKNIATVSNGVVKAKAPGKTVITASYKLEKKTRQVKCTVTVNKPKLSQEKLVLSQGTSAVLKVTGASQKAKWRSTNEMVATVKDGKVTAVGTGSCKIVATVNGVKLKANVQVRANEKRWNVVTRAGYYSEADDSYQISKVKRNDDGSITVEGYFVNTHIYDINSFDYFYIEVEDDYGNEIASCTFPAFSFGSSSYTVNPLVFTIPANNVKKSWDFTKNGCSFDWDYVFNYTF